MLERNRGKDYDKASYQVNTLISHISIIIIFNHFLYQVENLTVTVSKLHRQSIELSNIYSSKSVDENNLPTVSRQLINTNQCIVASLSNLVSTLNNLSHNLSDNLQRLANLVSTNFEEEEKPDGFVEQTLESSNVESPNVESVVESQLNVKLDEAKIEVGNLRHEIESLNEKLKRAEQVSKLLKFCFNQKS